MVKQKPFGQSEISLMPPLVLLIKNQKKKKKFKNFQGKLYFFKT